MLNSNKLKYLFIIFFFFNFLIIFCFLIFYSKQTDFGIITKYENNKEMLEVFDKSED